MKTLFVKWVWMQGVHRESYTKSIAYIKDSRLLCDSDGKKFACTARDLNLIPRSERSPGEGNGYPLQCSCLENPHGQRSLVGYSPWGHKELDATEMTNIDHLTKYHKII